MGGVLGGLFTNENARDAADAQSNALRSGFTMYSGLANEGRDALKTNYAAALSPYQKNYDQASAGNTAYGNATGANGPAGNAAALTSFQTSPGYQFSLDQGSQNLMRNKAATGQLASGGTNIDLQKLGIGQADQQWNQYIQNLLPYLNQSNSSAAGIAGVNTGLGNQLNASFTGEGNKAFDMMAGVGNANANADLANNQASSNSMSAIMQGIKLAASMAGGGVPGFGQSSFGGPSGNWVDPDSMAGGLKSFMG